MKVVRELGGINNLTSNDSTSKRVIVEVCLTENLEDFNIGLMNYSSQV